MLVLEKKMKQKNILVTGGAGFIGSHLCKNLINLVKKLFVLITYLLVNKVILRKLK